MRTFLLVSMVVAGIGASVGCSSSDDGGAGPGSTFDCKALCDELLSKGCANDTEQECLAECEEDKVDAGECVSQAGALYNCGTDQLTCDANGEASLPDGALIDSCFPQLIASVSCAACQVAAGDNACATCTKESCCAELKAPYDDPDFEDYFKCVTACAGDNACNLACVEQYPSIKADIEAGIQCGQANCATVCSAAP